MSKRKSVDELPNLEKPAMYSELGNWPRIWNDGRLATFLEEHKVAEPLYKHVLYRYGKLRGDES